MKEVKISKIEIKLGDRKLEFTVEEAKQLKELLESIFGATTTIIKEKGDPIYIPYIFWPYHEDPYVYPKSPWTITYGPFEGSTQTLCCSKK